MQIWRLQKGFEKKFRLGHPWVFSNELAHSPKGHPPGELVELRDAHDQFLAYGYGHPNSLIAFRRLSENRGDTINAQFISGRLQRASRLREIAGLKDFSHRLSFAEADGLPGLIIDRYFLVGGQQAFVVQSSTAGMDHLHSAVMEGLQAFVESEGRITWHESAVIISNDSKSRLLETVAVEPKRVGKSFSGFDPENARIIIQPALSGMKALEFKVDLLHGQKTGFFLDQRLNVHLALGVLQNLFTDANRTYRVLDICTYVGQWGAQIAHLATSMGMKVEVTLADASVKALDLAKENVRHHGGEALPEKIDVLENLGRLPQKYYDVVICDPPAFIKKKKDLPTGSNAYLKLNREALRRAKSGALYVSCSCSGLLSEEDFRSILAKASDVAGGVRWLLRGAHSPDHPQRAEFSQGTYLKSWIGLTEGNF